MAAVRKNHSPPNTGVDVEEGGFSCTVLGGGDGENCVESRMESPQKFRPSNSAAGAGVEPHPSPGQQTLGAALYKHRDRPKYLRAHGSPSSDGLTFLLRARELSNIL